MVLLLARCWDYKLKTEDVLELTEGNRRIALCTVVGLLEDGETYSTELKQRQRPAQGQMAQWEHELICQRYVLCLQRRSISMISHNTLLFLHLKVREAFATPDMPIAERFHASRCVTHP